MTEQPKIGKMENEKEKKEKCFVNCCSGRMNRTNGRIRQCMAVCIAAALGALRRFGAGSRGGWSPDQMRMKENGEEF